MDFERIVAELQELGADPQEIEVALVSLQGRASRFRLDGWLQVMAVARHYGWKPVGTERPRLWDAVAPPPDARWDGNYHRNHGQQVTAADARALAAALERARDEDPVHQAPPWMDEFLDLCRQGPLFIF